jgi:hypothetical protein
MIQVEIDSETGIPIATKLVERAARATLGVYRQVTEL